MNPTEQLIEYKNTLDAHKIEMIEVENFKMVVESEARIDTVEKCIEILENN